MRPNRSSLRHIARRAMLERGLLPDFSDAALAEAQALDERALAAAPGTRDLRALLWASIDNDDSRDLDQLSVAEQLSGGAVRVLVAIADVDAAVGKGSALDEHARTNTTSVYTAAQIFPMLPERLSTDLTSLNPGEDRLAMVVDMTVASDGTVSASDLYRALVHNHAKLAYDAVAAWLDEETPPPDALTAVSGLDEQVRMQDAAAQAMRRLRQDRGALSLRTPEAKAVFDHDVLTGLRNDEKNRAKELIEDLMLAANASTAQYLEAKGFPSLRRVLKVPARWPRIVQLAAEIGERLPAEADGRALEAFLKKQQEADPEGFPDLSLSVVKLLGSGEYGVDVPGKTADDHFGLAARDYTHATAPNRRYPDLVTQRLLKAAMAGTPSPYGEDELHALARHCTEQEDDAAKVERQVRKSAAALLLASRRGQRFNGIVTGASPKGTYVRIFDPPVEGRVMRGFEGLDVGDRVRVELVDTNVERGFIDFARDRS